MTRLNRLMPVAEERHEAGRVPRPGALWHSVFAPSEDDRALSLWRCLGPFALIPLALTGVAVMVELRPPGAVRIAAYLAAALVVQGVFLYLFWSYRTLLQHAERSIWLTGLAAIDPVTGLYNQRTAAALLDQHLVHARSRGSSCAVLFVDLDRFKSVNDEHGHQAGDAALREFARVVQRGLRDGDVVGRWGGDEFVAILPGVNGRAARELAERVRTDVATHTFRTLARDHLTCSIGVAVYPEHSQDRDGLSDLADRAMYRAKQAGRNRVYVSGGGDLPDELLDGLSSL